ncbi:MAG: 3'-phosphoesterase [Bacteroidales bacterium]|nr:3'-phosphoesterase [Bacteroidales bacterium]MCF8350534.1 3'-phosphoesterase [Bacteroidales bacterium]MCF8376581.1 3'-phosphoesterase [Bacteroidales bacterium]MCF8401166.1 3'-phosphoesterase [Bacteroidales bacterium]
MKYDKSDLNEYKEKRDFKKTTEPKGGKKKKSDKPRFVIQKHDASSLHYDFRIEIEGVMKSWAIPKGPSTDPSEKRLATLTEDHPIEYADFEGTIPEDQYGGGTVIVWDGGTYRNIRADKEDDGMSMQESFEDGKVEVWLEGKKLKGGYVLIHTKQGGNEKNWLFKKMKDEEADARKKPVKSEPKSILSDKTVEEMEKEMKKK